MLKNIRKAIEKFLKRYDKIDKITGSLDYWYFDEVKKPLVNWIASLILTSIPIILVLFCFQPSILVFQYGIGAAIAWWLIIEFVKDLKRCKNG